MTRRVAVPLLWALLGLVAGLFVLAIVLELNPSARARDWAILVPFAASAAFGTYFLTLRLLRFERHQRVRIRDHPRQMWALYPLWLLCSGGLGGSHVAMLYIYPFAAMSDVMIGNLAAIARTARAARR